MVLRLLVARVTQLVSVLLISWVVSTGIAQQAITFSGWSGEEGETGAVIQQMIEDFNTQSPDANVSWLGYPWAQVQQNFVLLYRSNDAPEVAQLQDRWLSTFGALDALVDLNEVFGVDTIATELNSGLLALGQYEGKQLGLPWVAGSIGMVANTKVLADAGIETLPETVDDFVDSLRSLKASNPDLIPFALMTQGNGTIAPDFEVWLWTFGGQIFDAEGNVTVNSPEALEALTFLKSLVDEDLVALEVGRGDARQLFAQHQTAFYNDAPVARGAARTNSGQGEAFDAFVEPMATPVLQAGDRSYQVGWGHLLVMFKQGSEGVDASSAGARFIEHLIFEPTWPREYFAAVSLLPSNQEAIASDLVQDDAYAANWLELAGSSVKVEEASLWPNGPQMTDVIGEEVQAVYLGQKSPGQALASMQQRLEALVAQIR
ncbi:MAG: sugar ABC transporter substrate-binding protein [Deinococcota bacterium]